MLMMPDGRRSLLLADGFPPRSTQGLRERLLPLARRGFPCRATNSRRVTNAANPHSVKVSQAGALAAPATQTSVATSPPDPMESTKSRTTAPGFSTPPGTLPHPNENSQSTADGHRPSCRIMGLLANTPSHHVTASVINRQRPCREAR